MTGGTSGLGAHALKQMAREPGTRVLLGARTKGPVGVETLPLDLARLDSVRSFASALEAAEIHALVLNAGLSLHEGSNRTPDGFETTFAVNHLSHYLLLRLLLPRMARNGIVTFTGSATHDPAAKTIIPAPRHADAQLLAYPDRDPERDDQSRTAGGRAYSSSKLCAVLTARALATQPEAHAAALTVVAYDPGPTPGTGLLRDAPAPVRAMWRILGTPMRAVVPRFNSVAAAGAALADIATGSTVPPPGEYHARLVRGRLTWLPPSELARSDDAMEALWHDSAQLVGLPAISR
ncbi:SDR family NAD(P)-dependent oxidoreductase [Plantactinospora sp. S1510]|uniref:SDR family NAD(P)-dependent oxidoreductase n=2 Tax=Plantactinospora alkalitolerans TaxID=2789879 RepID=A0ABS0H081_9ACTN|nr:SDR family NAD(P)-dependent oxidoreductase [Plantactinospora alkalitolerans]